MDTINKDVLGFLLDYKICFRCIMRMINIQTYEYYVKSDIKDYLIKLGFINNETDFNLDFNISLEENFINYIKNLKNVCIICLGILQIISMDDFSKLINKKIINEEIEFDDFQIHLKIPISIKLRYFYITFLLKKKFKEEELDNFNINEKIDIKQVFKWVLGPILSKELNKNPKYEEDFNLVFEFLNLDDEIKFNDYFKNEIKNHYLGKIKKNKRVHEDFEVKNVLTLNYFNLIINKHSDDIDQIIKIDNLLTDLNKTKLIFDIDSQNLYLFGNYIKFQRNISQTPWEIEGKKIVI